MISCASASESSKTRSPELPARDDGGLELGDLVHGNGERVVLPSAFTLNATKCRSKCLPSKATA